MPRTKGIKSSIQPRTMRPRVSRHGKLLADVYTVLVPAVTERKTVLNPDTNQYEAVTVETSKAYFRPMSPQEIAESRNSVLRATSPTVEGYRKNDGGGKAGKKAVKA